jgi:hypothetical protein
MTRAAYLLALLLGCNSGGSGSGGTAGTDPEEPPEGTPCVSTFNCPAGLVCERVDGAGQCVKNPIECVEDDDCEPGYICFCSWDGEQCASATCGRLAN